MSQGGLMHCKMLPSKNNGCIWKLSVTHIQFECLPAFRLVFGSAELCALCSMTITFVVVWIKGRQYHLTLKCVRLSKKKKKKKPLSAPPHLHPPHTPHPLQPFLYRLILPAALTLSICNFHCCINIRTDDRDTCSFPFDVVLCVGDCNSKVCEHHSLCLCVPFFTWGQTLLTGITEGNKSAFTDKLDWWIDPWFNPAGYQEQQISIHVVKKHTHTCTRARAHTHTHTSLWSWKQSRWIHNYIQYSSSSRLAALVTVNVSTGNVSSIILHLYH